MNLLVKNNFVKTVELHPKVQNLVATVNFEREIDIEDMARRMAGVTYEPDQFPGAILRNSDGSVYLIFSSGRIVLVGLKSEGQVSTKANNIKLLLKGFLKKK